MLTQNEILIIAAAVLAVLAIYMIPIAMIVGRMGFSRWWVFFVFVPLGQLIGLWLLALNRWPALDGSK